MYLPDVEALVVADLHLGRGRQPSIQAPLDAAVDLSGRLEALCNRFEPTRVIFAGDVLDAFDRVPPGVVDRVERLCDVVAGVAAEPVFVAGNHDRQLPDLLDAPIHDAYRVGNTVVCHGHERPPSADRYVIGHVHPALRVEGVKHPCYLAGEGVAAGADVVVLPAFSPLLRGTVIIDGNGPDSGTPLLASAAVGSLRPIVWDPGTEAPLTFPTLTALASVT